MKHISIITILLLAAFSLSAQSIQNGVLTIPDGTTEIKYGAYYGNTEIKKVIVPNSVTKISGLAFHSCANLVEIDIPGSVKTIGDAAFQNCTALSKVTLHNGVTALKFRAFKNTAIEEITVPSSVTEVGSEVFGDCKNLTTIRVDKYSEAHACYSNDSRLVFTDKKPKQTKEQWIATAKHNIIDDGILYVAKGVNKIRDGQYKNKGIKEIRFSDTVNEIGGGAFRGNTELKKVVVPGNVKIIRINSFSSCSNLEEVVIEDGVEELQGYSFYACRKLKSVTFPKSIRKIITEGLFWETNSSVLFHCYVGSAACEFALKSNYPIDIIGIDEDNVDKIDMKQISLSNMTIKAGLFQNMPFERIDLNNDIAEIGKNAFHDKSIIRVKRNTYGDKWCKENGYYLCGALADLSTYTKDKSKEIKEDFTRIACDDTPYAEWTSYSFRIQQPLKLEEVDNKLVLTSFMLYPCKNVTVTTKAGKTLMSKKTIQPLTRTVICDFDFLTDSVKNYSVSTDDDFYRKITSIKTNWNISFHGYYIRKSEKKNRIDDTMRPVYVREWIATVYDMAFVAGLPEFERRCYEAVEKKTLVTDKKLTVPLTKEQMDGLLKKTWKWTLQLGRNKEGFGGGGGSTLHLAGSWIRGIPTSKNYVDAHAFWHEFSHCMGWGHEQGNMCYLGRPAPYDTPWPGIAAKLYVEELKKRTPPYIEGSRFFNSGFFSGSELNFNPDDDVIKDNTLYIADGMPYTDSHKNQTDFTKVEIPPSVEIVSDSAFYGTKLNEVSIPSSVTHINKLAFQNCVFLKNIDISDTVKSVGDSAFQNCTLLETVKIGKGMRQLNYRLFKSTALRKVTIPKNIKYIGKEAFAGCRSLTSITIENGVRKIGDNAFDGTAIMELTIPESVTMIGKNITSKYVVWDVKEGSYAYKFALENNIPIKKDNGTLADNAARILNESKNAELAPNDSWTNGTFTSSDVRRKWDFSDYLNKGEGGTCTITFTYTSGRHGFDITDALFTADGKGIAYFPEKRFAGHSPSKFYYTVKVPKGTKKFEMFALARGDGGIDSNGMITVNNPDLRKLVIPQSTEVIKSSFYFGSNFEEVILPQGLKKIENNAFQNCPNLKSIDIPDSVTEMGSAVFQYCSSLETVKIGSGIKKINNTMFNHSGLKKVYIPDSLTGIGKEAFANCVNFAEITIPNAVTDIGNSAFQNCENIAEVIIPNAVTDIGDSAFQNCKNLKKVEIGSGVTKIDKSAFEKTAIEAINIPDTATAVGKNAFSSCASLTTAKLGKGLTELSFAVFQDSGLKEITIPKNVVTVADKAFQSCKNLKKVVIGSGVTKIGKSAFEKTCLTNITIPKNVELIDEKAFQDCKSLENVIIENGVKQIGWRAFNGTAIRRSRSLQVSSRLAKALFRKIHTGMSSRELTHISLP